ncbi:MAG: DNA mismatch repair protein MutL [Phycisphaerae bacterium]|nr:DNA mismatch repair protein MutL [Phycisphaerae bacterium]
MNRIAAGECVERPASVVKELVENALDAGAGRIDIVVEGGGRDLIRVSDDGRGMDADDLRLCVQPHATSKIADDDDLFRIHTLGFRGEALPSIGSVARLRITTRRQADRSNRPAPAEPGSPEFQSADEDGAAQCVSAADAHTLTVEGGSVGALQPAGAPPGTVVEVRDLFFNVPARRRFLRTPQTEMSNITEQLARIALPHPEISFSLVHGGRVVYRLPAAAEQRKRLSDFYGPELASVLMPVARAVEGLRIDGLVAPPAECRGSSKWEYLFVNGRYVRDKFVSHAVKEAYRSLIQPGQYPVSFLFVTIDPGAVDVNVHPMKMEVRWRDSNFIHGQVLAAIRELFLRTNLDRRLRTPESDDYRERVRSAMVDYFTQARPAAGSAAAVPPASGTLHRSAGPPLDLTGELATHPGDASRVAHRPQQSEPPAVSPPAAHLMRLPAESAPFAPPPSHAERFAGGAPDEAPPAANEPYPTARSDAARRAAAELVGTAAPGPASRQTAIQIHRSYLVVETADGLMIIDQHALHERVLYEQLRQRIAQRPLESQRLLIPDVVRVAPDRIAALEPHAATLARLGIEVQPAGPNTVMLSAFPTFLERLDRVGFVRGLLDALAEHGARPETDSLVHHLLDMMACKAAVKAGDELTSAEIAALLSSRELAERSSNCPHGRPTTLHLTLRDLERQFKRH